MQRHSLRRHSALHVHVDSTDRMHRIVDNRHDLRHMFAKRQLLISSTARDANTATASGSATVSVGGQPVANAVTCPTTGVTSGKAFSCSASGSGGTSPYTYTWTLPAACTGTSTTSTISVTCSPKGTYSISSTARDSNA